MNLSNKEVEVISKEIIDKAGTFKCPVCGQCKGFNVSPHEFHLLSGNATPIGVDLSGNITYERLVSLTCNNCGHVAFFNRITLERLTSQK